MHFLVHNANGWCEATPYFHKEEFSLLSENPVLPEKEWLEGILHASTNGLIAIDREGRILFFNQAAERLTAITREAALFQPISRVIPQSDLQTVTRTGQPIAKKWVVNGKVVMSNHSPVYVKGELAGAVAVLQDISEREAIMTEIESYKRLVHQLDTIIEATQDGLYLTDGDGITLRVNSAYEKMTGFHREELVGKHMSWLEDKGMISQSISLQVLKSKSPLTQIQKLSNNKEIIVSSVPVKDEQDNVIMVASTIRDITYLNTLEKELEKSRKLNETFSGEIAHFRHMDTPEAELVFRSEAMKGIVSLIHQVSHYPTTVMLRGETGVGKEVLASMIHYNSPRAKKPFIKVNCSAIPENLLESELFGYERGAFSGALKNGKPGLFELAHQGTLLLDEIGDLPPGLQAKLLRVLQDRELRRVGGTKTIPVDIRIISATNRDLKQMIENGSFREDLYYRLNVIDIFIPPLRQRQEDIAPLLHYYLKKFCKAYGITRTISEEAMNCLLSYHWPGNIREIRNLLENLVVSTASVDIRAFHLPSYMKENARMTTAPSIPATPHSNLATVPAKRHPLTLKQAVARVEQELILQALKNHDSIRKAASVLHIDHSTLIRKMRKWGMPGHGQEIEKGCRDLPDSP